MNCDPLFQDLIVSTENDGSIKWSGAIYNNFRNKYRITSLDYKCIYGNIDYTKIFYDREEIRDITKKYLA